MKLVWTDWMEWISNKLVCQPAVQCCAGINVQETDKKRPSSNSICVDNLGSMKCIACSIYDTHKKLT